MSYLIKPLEKTSRTVDFQCGQAPLDEYILRYASQDVRKNMSRIFVACPESNPQQLAGYFTLSAGSVHCTQLPPDLARKLPRYPIPVALIGRLAVARDFQGKGLGSILLSDACQKVVQASAVLAVAGIVVDAKDEAAKSFYQHFGFIPLQGAENRLLLPMAALKTLYCLP